jgi:hypothetical protein
VIELARIKPENDNASRASLCEIAQILAASPTLQICKFSIVPREPGEFENPATALIACSDQAHPKNALVRHVHVS